MFPLNLRYGPWPASGEVDVAEGWSADPSSTPLPATYTVDYAKAWR
jgi:hypothetical protein